MEEPKLATGGIYNGPVPVIGGDDTKGEVIIPLSQLHRYTLIQDGDGVKLVPVPPREETILDRIYKIFQSQAHKGLNKYGHTLDQCPDDKFDWKLMAMEELIDLVQYQQKEIIRLERLLNQ